MISRVQDTTKLEFDPDYIKTHFWPCSACSAYRSYRGWWLSSLWPYVRAVPKALKAAAGTGDTAPDTGAILDGRVHWSVKERLGRLGLVDQDRYAKYAPKNLSVDAEYTEHSLTEDALIALCHSDQDNKKREGCALYCKLEEAKQGWWSRARWRTNRMRRLRDNWKDIITAQS
jgi:hypothetical protein